MGGKDRGRKRSATEEAATADGVAELHTPDGLPPSVEALVAEGLQRWRPLRGRIDALRPALDREEQLMQDILDRGLRGQDRKTLRRLVSDGREAEELTAELAASLGEEAKAELQDILMKSQRTLLELSASTAPEYKMELVTEMDAVLDALRAAQGPVLEDLATAKASGERSTIRTTGRALNELKGLLRRLDTERHGFTRSSSLAALLVTVCRRVLPVRPVEPARLGAIAPSHEGYMHVLDFYFFSDASVYCFGEHLSGPNWFTKLKRNIAVLLVTDAAGRPVYNEFAVSGMYRTPGAPLAPDDGPLTSIEAEDEHGHVFDRQHDAEFKLLTRFCLAATAGHQATLWSKKPLCLSCAGAVRQVRARYPALALKVLVGEGGFDG